MEYTIDDIKIIRGLSFIRKHPHIYFSHHGRDISIYLLQKLLESLIDPKYACCATNIKIKPLNKGGVRLQYNGNGMPIDNVIDGGINHPIIYTSVMQLHKENQGIYYGHLHEIGPYLAAMSKELTIVTWQENKSYSVSFEYGAINSLLKEETIYSTNEIYIDFSPEIMDGEDISSKDIDDLIEWSYKLFPGVLFNISNS
jgi:DNA gyrase/topoisomerase IV subunit B